MLTDAERVLLRDIRNISSSLVEDDIISLSGGEKDLTPMDKICTKYLRMRGLRVSEPLEPVNKASNIIELITSFYALRDRHYPEYIGMRNKKMVDESTAKNFIDARVNTGISRKTAIQECASLIQMFFEHKDLFNFEEPITFSVFGQKYMGWVTEKLLKIYNKRRHESLLAVYNEYKNNKGVQLGIPIEELSEEDDKQ